jgi:protein-S-isoprenylcysteine O-methyltransferase Ste14
MSLQRWFYRGGRPNRVARALDRFTAALSARGVGPDYLVTLEVPGRRSGRIVSLPLVVAVVNCERYLVSMLGEGANWVRNVEAAGGDVVLRHGNREEVHLEKVAPERRVPVLKAYLERATNASAHLPIDKDAPLIEFERISSRYPMFRIMPREVNESGHMTNVEQDHPGIRVPPPLIYLLPLISGLLLDREAHVPFLPSRAARSLGWALLGSGVLLSRWFLRTMRKADAPVRTDRPVPRLTTEGPFRYTRNPGYLAMAMIYAGVATLRNALWAILLLPLVLYVTQREVIGREERYLERTFGKEYLTYKARVHRWV